MTIKYCLCKHGPRCSRYRRGECGFAHDLQEVGIPDQVLHPRRWIDESHEQEGFSGIDFFLGQRYTFAQHCRILMYVAHCRDDVPEWVNRYLWFMRHSLYQPRSEDDLGLYREVLQHASFMPHRSRIPDCADALGLLEHWNKGAV